MKTQLIAPIIAILLLQGCILWPQAWKDCGTDKKCLEDAFKNCEMARGMWEGDHGDMNVSILGKAGENCKVGVTAAETDLDITGKSMTCEVPITENASFSIMSNCTGELKDFISE